MQAILVYALAAAALGGFDSIWGAVICGIIVGVADALTIQYVDALDGIEIVLPLGADHGGAGGHAQRAVRQAHGGEGLMTEQTGAALEPAIGDVPIVADETPPGTRPSLWPAVPRRVLVARMVDRRRAGGRRPVRAPVLPAHHEPGAVAGHLPGHRGHGPQPAHRVQRPGVDRARCLLRRRGVHLRDPHGRPRLDLRGDDPRGRPPQRRRRRPRRRARPAGPGPLPRARHARPGRPVPACRPEVRRRHRRRGAAAAAAERVRVAHRRPRRRPVGVLPVPGDHGRAVRAGLEPRARAGGPGDDRRARPGDRGHDRRRQPGRPRR